VQIGYLKGLYCEETLTVAPWTVGTSHWMFAQIFANRDFVGVAYPMERKFLASDSFRQFVNDFGRPEHLTMDRLREQCGKNTEFMHNIRKYCINHTVMDESLIVRTIILRKV
jgi:hypothetical protein